MSGTIACSKVPVAPSAVIAHVSRPDTVPFVVSCAEGRDRTGIVVACLLDLLDVNDEAIALDYAQSDTFGPQNGRAFVTELSERTRHHILTMFAAGDIGSAERLLEDRCGGATLPGISAGHDELIERIQLAALRLSAGRLDGLNKAVELAALDWRDLLVAAGFADDTTAHTRWQPRAFTAADLDHWMAGGSLPGVEFAPKQPVIVTTGPNVTDTGSVVSLEALEPEARYRVELASGIGITVFQRWLVRGD